MAALIHTSAKDFSRHPELLASHVDRIQRAHASAAEYMHDTPLRTVGLIRMNGFRGAYEASRIAEEIWSIGIGDSKRPDSLARGQKVNGHSRQCAQAMWPVISSLFSRRHGEVARKFDESTYLQHIFNSPDDNDKQKVFHCDTFFPAIKYWYFPEAVTIEDGPLWYVPNSPILSIELLAWHQRQVDWIRAGTVEPWRGHGHMEGSLRISESEIAEFGLTPEPVTVDADTLIIANVFGFHRRGDTTKPTHRVSIHGSIRIDNPI